MAIIGKLFVYFTLTLVWEWATAVPTTKPPKGMEGRVVGGAISKSHQFPYLISIGDTNTPGNHMCGGSLIKENLVLTAAHCFFYPMTTVPFKGIKLGFTAGEHSLKAKDGSEQMAEIKTLVIKRGYDPIRPLNDIALVELSKPFKLNDASVKTIKLATAQTKFAETNCTVSGWGYTKQLTMADQQNPEYEMKPEDLPDTPRFLQLDIIKKGECAKLTVNADVVAHPGTLCAGGKAGKGNCRGDSGGPLACVSSGAAAEDLLVGIVSASPGCAIENSPTMYTSVVFMESWIKKAEAALTDPKQQVVNNIILI